MHPSKRIFVNTIAQYIKAVIDICLALYTTRLILSVMGQDDYGIYQLVAGVILMLGFLTNAMVITTQRHLSYQHGQQDARKVRMVFSNSVLLHLGIGVAMIAVLMVLRNFLVFDYLNIADSRRDTASVVYTMSVLMLFVTFVTAPFKALYIARENIVYISVVEVCDAVLKLVLALLLINMQVDKLLIYSYMMITVHVINFLAFAIYAMAKFQECSPRHFFADYDKTSIKALSGFAAWTTYGMGSIMLRNQGLQVVLNKEFGTVVNSAYGLANQIYSKVSFLSTSVVNAMNPQIMKAEGAGERQKMLMLAEMESKIVTMLMSLMFIPLIVEMPNVLAFWLKDVPPYTLLFSQILLVCFIVDQTTYGLQSANQAIGNIRGYTLIMYTPKLLFLVVVWVVLRYTASVAWVMYLYLILEAVMAFVRLLYMKYTADVRIMPFVMNVVVRIIPMALLLVAVSMLLKDWFDFRFGFLLTITCAIIVGGIYAWFGVLRKTERDVIANILKSKIKK